MPENPDVFEPDIPEGELPSRWIVADNGYQTTVRIESRNSNTHIILQEWDEDTYCVTPMVPSKVRGAMSENDKTRTETFNHIDNAINYAIGLAHDLAEEEDW